MTVVDDKGGMKLISDGTNDTRTRSQSKHNDKEKEPIPGTSALFFGKNRSSNPLITLK